MTDVATLLPGPAARDGGQEYARAIWSGVDDLEDQAIELRDGLHDIDIARGIALDIRGDWVGERRLGLGDAEYRRIIRGREVAMGGGVLPFAVANGWRELTGSDNITMDAYGAEVVLTAEVQAIPSAAWVARARAIMLDLIGAGIEFYATIYTPDSFRFGVHNFDQRGFAVGFGSN